MNLNVAKKSVLPVMNLVRMQGVPILDQLHLEERLLRCDFKNWCIINVGTPQPTIVMGISGEAVPLLQLYPRPIMSWTGTLYQDALRDFGKFSLRENDYVFDNLKFGGNAQSITKNKWIHHTSFLWDYDVRNMDYLKHPQRTPKYRSERSHTEFLCRMKDIIPSKLIFIEKTLNSLQKHFVVQPIKPDDISNAPYAPSSRLLTRQELERELLSIRA